MFWKGKRRKVIYDFGLEVKEIYEVLAIVKEQGQCVGCKEDDFCGKILKSGNFQGRSKDFIDVSQAAVLGKYVEENLNLPFSVSVT